MEDSNPGHKLRALVVDDNEANRAFASAAMEDECFDVEAAASANEALALFETFQPDCVLLDVRMPDKDGFAACRELRALPGGRSSAVVFLTAARNAETFDLAVAAGADDFITKPVMANELVARVCSAVRRKTLSRAALALHSIFNRHRLEIARHQASNEGTPEERATLRALDELSDYVERLVELSGDLTRGALEESLAGQSEPLEHRPLLESRP
jgi:DNA-binding response OmpR family regulator